MEGGLLVALEHGTSGRTADPSSCTRLCRAGPGRRLARAAVAQWSVRTGDRARIGWAAMTGDRAPDPVATPVRPGVGVANIANLVTLVRLLIVPVFGWLLLAHPDENGFRIAAVVAFVVASLTDRVDGELARRRGLVTEVGKLADPIADKALMGTALVALSLLHELTWWFTVVILVREIGITVLRFRVLRRGVIAASRGGKAKTMLQAVAIGLYLLPLPDWFGPVKFTVMAITVVVTVLTGIDYLLSAWRRSRAQRARIHA